MSILSTNSGLHVSFFKVLWQRVLWGLFGKDVGISRLLRYQWRQPPTENKFCIELDLRDWKSIILVFNSNQQIFKSQLAEYSVVSFLRYDVLRYLTKTKCLKTDYYFRYRNITTDYLRFHSTKNQKCTTSSSRNHHWVWENCHQPWRNVGSNVKHVYNPSQRIVHVSYVCVSASRKQFRCIYCKGRC